MHLVDASVGLMGSSSIVGGGIPIATGLGLAIQMMQQDLVSVVFFGDGAVDEGCVYESVNFAILKNLPVVYVYENNHFSVCSHVSSRHYGDVIFHHLPQEHLFSKKIDGNSVLEVYEAARQAVDHARSGQGPAFIECDTYRIRGHAGTGDSPDGYRSREVVLQWTARCPVGMFRDRLVKEGLVRQGELSEMDKQIEDEIKEAFLFAVQSELPQAQDLHRYLYHG
jgi:pyruvate dehydrogenase E1 component alpha subunit